MPEHKGFQQVSLQCQLEVDFQQGEVDCTLLAEEADILQEAGIE